MAHAALCREDIPGHRNAKAPRPKHTPRLETSWVTGTEWVSGDWLGQIPWGLVGCAGAAGVCSVRWGPTRGF